jgi:hypothetical protein
VKLGKNVSDTYVILSKAYGGEAMKKSGVFEWHKRSKEDYENVEDAEITSKGSAHHIL